MSDRGVRLVKIADEQIGGLIELFSMSDEAVLSLPVPGREKLGDGTVAACASHTAENYLRIAGFVVGDDHLPGTHSQRRHRARHIPFFPRPRQHRGGHDPGRHSAPYAVEGVSRKSVIARLSVGRKALKAIGGFSDAQFDAVPPASDMKFCDGQRTLEQIVTSLFNHQGHQVDALRAALTASD